MGTFFTAADMAAPGGSWSWLAGVAGQAIEQGSEDYLEDALASVQPWGFRPDAIGVPVLIMHGAKDKMVPSAHGERRRPAPLPDAESADLLPVHRRSTDRVGAIYSAFRALAEENATASPDVVDHVNHACLCA